jgi:hypothetical protein
MSEKSATWHNPCSYIYKKTVFAENPLPDFSISAVDTGPYANPHVPGFSHFFADLRSFCENCFLKQTGSGQKKIALRSIPHFQFGFARRAW